MVQSPELRPLWQGVYMRRFGTQPRVPRALSLGVGVAATAHCARFPLLLPETPQAQTQQRPQAQEQPQRLQFQDNTAVAVVSATPTTERGEGEYCWRSLCMERHAEQTDWLWRTRGWEAVKDAGHVRETLWVGPTHEFSSLLEAVHASAAFDRIIVDAPASYAFAPEIVLLPHSIEICGLQRRAASSTDMALSSGCESDSAGEGRGRDDNDNDGERNRDGNGNGATATGAREGIVVEAGAVEFVYRSPPTPPTQPTQRHEPVSPQSPREWEEWEEAGQVVVDAGCPPAADTPPVQLDTLLLLRGTRTCVRLQNIWLRPGGGGSDGREGGGGGGEDGEGGENGALFGGGGGGGEEATPPAETVAGVSIGQRASLQVDDCILERVTVSVETHSTTGDEMGSYLCNRSSLIACDLPVSMLAGGSGGGGGGGGGGGSGGEGDRGGDATAQQLRGQEGGSGGVNSDCRASMVGEDSLDGRLRSCSVSSYSSSSYGGGGHGGSFSSSSGGEDKSDEE